MKTTLEEPAKRGMIEPQSLPPGDFTKVGLRERISPLRRGPVRIAERYAVADIARPVHQPQTLMIQPRVGEMVFYHYRLSCNSSRLANQEMRFLRMVKHVHQHDDIVRGVGERQDSTVELLNRYRGSRTRAYLDARGVERGPASHDRSRQGSVTAADVEQRRDSSWNHLGDVVGQCLNATSKDQLTVQCARDARKYRVRHVRWS